MTSHEVEGSEEGLGRRSGSFRCFLLPLLTKYVGTWRKLPWDAVGFSSMVNIVEKDERREEGLGREGSDRKGGSNKVYIEETGSTKGG